SGIEVRAQRAEFGLALRLEVLRGLRRPVERQAQHFATADFTRGFHHQRVAAGRKIAQRRLALLETQAMLAGRARRAAHAVDREAPVAPAAAPPLAQVGQPLAARFALAGFGILAVLELVPDREIGGDAAVGALDPDRHVRAVVFGHV